MANESYPAKQITEWIKKADKWDALEKEIAKFYTNADGEYDEDNPEREGDLIAIGEVAANAFGWI